jgi:hypothetical protein
MAAAGLALSQDKSPQSTPPKLSTPRETQTNAPAGSVKAPANNVKARADYPVVGYLAGRDRTITIKAGPKGPVYSVKTAEGMVLCENLSANQLRAQSPELADFLKSAVAGPAGAKLDAGLRIKIDASVR